MAEPQTPRQLYESRAISAPAWDQLGAGTHQEWERMFLRKQDGDPEWWSIFPPKQRAPAAQSEPQGSLF